VSDAGVSAEAVLTALRWLAMPVCVVGAGVGADRSCATGTMSYVTLEPAVVATSLALSSRTYDIAHRAGAFSLSLLREDQDELAVAAARRATSSDKFSDLSLDVRWWNDVPALSDCGAVLWCSIDQEHVVGDHVVCVGGVHAAYGGLSDASALLRYAGGYHAVGRRTPAVDDAPYPL
jgi:flavin reductase (DIM6/NTAB) family NADH-FMN oxidoreductase RutF